MYYNNILEVIGNTPLVKINKLNPNPRVLMLAKLESFNPGGSIKDRIGMFMVQKAIESKKLKKGGTVVEATGAGNTGIGIAITACILGFKSLLVLPDKVSEEKRNLLKAYGAKIVIAPTSVAPEDPRSYYRVADRLAIETPCAFQPDQYSNPANPETHYQTTGPEIWNQTEGKVTHVIIGMGTGGTISGVGKYLKEKNPHIHIIGVDHTGSVYFDYFKNGKLPKVLKSYKTEGIGEDFLPKTMDFSVVDEVYQVDDKECFDITRRLAKEEGILVGGTSGAVLLIARKVVKKLKKGLVVMIMPDSGVNYLSKFYNDDWMRDFGFLDEPKDTIQPLLNKKLHFISVLSSSTPCEAIKLMHKYKISQLPVVEDKKVVGTITEGILLKKMYGNLKIPVSVSEIMDKDFIELPSNASMSQLAQSLSRREMVIITDKKGKPVDVLTRIDFLANLN